MSHKLQFRSLTGLVAVITIIVGMLVWPAPKEAMAQTTVYVSMLDTDDNHFIEGIDLGVVHFHFYLEDDLVDAGSADDEVGGVYSFTTVKDITEFDEWEVELDPPPQWIDFPAPAYPNPCFRQSYISLSYQWYIDDMR